MKAHLLRRRSRSLRHRLTRLGRARTASGCLKNLRSAPAVSDPRRPRIGYAYHRRVVRCSSRGLTLAAVVMTKTVPARSHWSRASILLAVLSVAVGVLLLGHAAVQGIGAAIFWGPCWSEGHESAACSFLQYEAPSPAWLLPYWVWFVEVLLAFVVIVASVAAGRRVGTAGLALVAVLASSLLVDYVFTPIINGGHTSADNPPGFGLIGAAFHAIGGALMLRVAISYRRPIVRRGVLGSVSSVGDRACDCEAHAD